MKKTEALILNIDFKQDNKHIQSTSKLLHNHGIGVTTTDFWSIPTYITEAIANNNIHIIILSFLPKSRKEDYDKIIKQLNKVNMTNLPVIAFQDTMNEKEEYVTLNGSGINNTLSISDAENETIITYIKQLIDSKNEGLLQPKKIAHIGIAVKSIEETLPFYTDLLGLQFEGIEKVKSEGVKVAFLKIGESRIELLEPLTDSSPIQRFLRKSGEGIHHIALEVDNIKDRLNHFKTKGIDLINEQPKQGAGNSQIAFIHPRSANGVLFELCQYTGEGKE